MKENRWLRSIKSVLTRLGGRASLAEIYEELEKTTDIDLTKYEDWQSRVRTTIYLHSSDCDIFKGVKGDEKDLFYAVNEKGDGVWGLRR